MNPSLVGMIRSVTAVLRSGDTWKIPSASPGPQVGGATGSSNSSRQTTVGLSVLKTMNQPYGAATSAGNLSVSNSMRRPDWSAPNTPNWAATTSTSAGWNSAALLVCGVSGAADGGAPLPACC